MIVASCTTWAEVVAVAVVVLPVVIFLVGVLFIEATGR